MYELITQLSYHLRGIWRYHWKMLLTCWLACLLGWLVVYSLPDEYATTTRVYVDTQSILKPLLKGLAIETDVMSEVDIITRTMVSRPNLEKVARETDLDLRAKNPKQFEKIVAKLHSKIKIESDRKERNLFTISYHDPDPQTSKNVVQTLLDSFVQESLGSKRVDSGAAQKFLLDQIKEHEQRLTLAEQRLADFKKKYVGLMPSEGSDYYARLNGAIEALNSLRTEYKLKNNKRAVLQQQLRGEKPVFSAQRGANEIDVKIGVHRENLESLLLKYTEKHPDVVELRETLAQLEARKAEQEMTQAPKPSAVNSPNPVYQQIRIALGETEIEMSALRSKIADQQRRVDDLKKNVDTIPEVEADLARLNRDYDVTKNQYEALVGRLESAKLSQDVGKSNEGVKFRIIEPPKVPLAPAGPPRLIYLSAVLLAGIGAGIGLAFLLHQASPVYSSARGLRDLLGLPVFGTVGEIFLPREKMKRRFDVFSFILASILLLVAYGGVVIFHSEGAEYVQSVLLAGVLP